MKEYKKWPSMSPHISGTKFHRALHYDDAHVHRIIIANQLIEILGFSPAVRSATSLGILVFMALSLLPWNDLAGEHAIGFPHPIGGNHGQIQHICMSSAHLQILSPVPSLSGHLSQFMETVIDPPVFEV